MELWKIHLTTSESITIKAKKKDLFKAEKRYLTAKLVDSTNEHEIFLNRNSIVWIAKEEKEIKEKAQKDWGLIKKKLVSMKTKILIVDDEDDILELLKYNLEKENYSVITAKNGFEALQKIELKPNLIILDLMMPIIDGLETLKKIKEKDEYKDIPVIFLTAKTSESSEIAGLNSGASDFLLKPVSVNKLLARIKANLRRYTEKESLSSNSIIEIEGLKIDPEKFIVTINSQPVEFSKTEFLILLLLASKRGRVFKRSNILDQVWGDNVYVTERTVDVHLLKIRKKLGEYAYLIETVKGIGYRFKDE